MEIKKGIFRWLSLFVMVFAVNFAVANKLYVTNLTDSNPGSLRDQIANAGVGDTVYIDVSGTLSLLSTIDFNKDIVVVGPGPIHFTINGTGMSGQNGFRSLTGNYNVHIEGIRAFGFDFPVLEMNSAFSGGFEVKNSLFESNIGSVGNCDGGTLKMEGCSFIDNTNNVVMYIESSLNLINCTFSSNNAGAVHINNGSSEITHCTFYENGSSIGLGKAIRQVAGTLKLKNNIIFNDTQDDALIEISAGTLTSLGGNITNDMNTPNFGSGFGDIENISLNVGISFATMVTDGWGLKYFPPAFGSDGIDIDASPDLAILYDQRRVWRVMDSGGGDEYSDAGAVEYSPLTTDLAGIGAPGTFEYNFNNVYPGLNGNRAFVFDINGAAPYNCPFGAASFNLIHENTIINGFSQNGSRVPGPGTSSTNVTSAFTPIILVNSASLINGIEVNANSAVIAGVSVVGFNAGGAAIKVDAYFTEISGCHIGVTENGNTITANSNGIEVGEFGSAEIGSKDYCGHLYHSNRNVISGNVRAQITINGGESQKIQHNFIGLSSDGINVPTGAPSTIDTGIVFREQFSINNPNYIGGENNRDYNVIGAQLVGISIATDGNKVLNNIIGGGFTGDFSNANVANTHGVLLSGLGATGNRIGQTGAGNVIIGSNAVGVRIQNGASNNEIYGNNIGMSINGDIAIGNSDQGILISGMFTDGNRIGNIGQGNNIGNGQEGITIDQDASGNFILDNYIGFSADGSFAPMGPSIRGIYINGDGTSTNRNVIGDASAGNVIGNTGDAIYLEGPDSTIIQNNYIGFRPDGITAAVNSGNGIHVKASSYNLIGGCNANEGNYIGNNVQGIQFEGISADFDTIMGNYIGVSLDGSDAGNSGNGINFDEDAFGTAFTDILIGDDAAGCANEIAYNTNGVYTGSSMLSDKITISGNSFHDNSDIGIDLGGDGENGPGDDSPPVDNNDAQTAYLHSAVFCGASTKLSIEVKINANVRFEAFKASDGQEGDSLILQEDIAMTFGNVHEWDIGNVPPGTQIVVTASYDAGFRNTSEFSSMVTVAAPTALSPTIDNASVCPYPSTLPVLSVSGYLGTAVWYEDATLTMRIDTGASLSVPFVDGTFPGVYNYYVIDSTSGCSSSVSPAVTMTVVPAPVYTITGPSVLCVNNNYQYAISRPASFTTIDWSFAPEGSPFTSYYNSINEGSQTVGAEELFDVDTYTASASGTNDTITVSVDSAGCISNAEFYVGVIQEDPTFTMGTSFCTNDANPVPAITGTLGGVFTINNGGSINSSTGEVDLFATTAGNNNVTYTTPNCGETHIIPITIEQAPEITMPADINICVGESNNINPSVVGTDSPTYDWTPVTYLSSTNTVSTSVNPTASGAYTYSLEVTNLNGCLASEAINVNIISSPISVGDSVRNVTSCGGSDGAVGVGGLDPSDVLTLYYNTSSSALLNVDANGWLFLTGLSAGSYKLDSISNGPCTSTLGTTFTLVNPSPITVTSIAIADPTSCGGEGTMSVTINNPNPFSMSLDLEYDAVNPGAEETYGSVLPGNSAVTATTSLIDGFTISNIQTSSNGCSSTFNTTPLPYTFNDPAGPVADAGSGQTVCFGDLVNFNGLPVGTGFTFAWDFGDGNFTTANTNSSASNTYGSAGSYTVQLTVTDASNCSDTDDLIVTVNTPPTISGENDLCFGETLNLLPNTGGTWTSSDGSVASIGSASGIVTTVGTGSVDFSFTDGAGCITTSSQITINPLPYLGNSSVTDVDCFGDFTGAIMIVPSGTYNHSWAGPSGYSSSSVNISGLEAGSYTNTMQDAGTGCFNTFSTTVNQPTSAFFVTLSSSLDPQCAGGSDGSASVSYTGGTVSGSPVYDWYSDVGLTTLIASNVSSMSTLSAGTYYVEGTDDNSCTHSISITINDPAPIIVNASISSNYNGEDISCSGFSDGEVTCAPTGGTISTDYYYYWSPILDYNQTVSGLPAGSYDVTVSDDNGCTIMESVTLTDPAMLFVDLGTDISICEGTNANLFASSAGGANSISYAWNNGLPAGQSHTVSPSDTTVYSVTATDANFCMAYNSVTVNVMSKPDISSFGPTIKEACFNANDGEINYGTGPASTWYLDGVTSPNIMSNLAPNTYEVVYEDGNGCRDTVNHTIIENTQISYSEGVNNASCNTATNGLAFVPEPSILGGTPDYIVNWSSDNNYTNDLPVNDSLFNRAPGWQYFNIVDGNGCMVFDSVEVGFDVIPTPILFYSTSDSCLNNNSYAFSVGSGLTINTYSWYFEGGTSPDLTVSNPTSNYISAGIFDVGLTYFDFDGCYASDTIQIEVYDTAGFTASGTDLTCNGAFDGEIAINVLSGGSNCTFEINGSGFVGSGSTHNFSSLAAGSHTISVVNEFGCIGSSQFVSLVEPSAVVVSISEDFQAYCPSDTSGVVAGAIGGDSGPYSYDWYVDVTNTSIGTGADSLQSRVDRTVYCIATDGNGCKDTSNVVIVDIPDGLTVTETITDVTCFGLTNGLIDLSVSGGAGSYSYVWTGPTATVNTNNFTNLSVGLYNVNITDGNNCIETFGPYDVLEPQEITATLNFTDVSCFGQTDGIVDVTSPTGGNGAPYTYNVNFVSNTLPYNGRPTGEYVVEVIDQTGCVSGYLIDTIFEPSLMTFDTLVVDATCGLPNGSVEVTNLLGGSGMYSIEIDAQFINPVTNLAPGSYSIVISDANSLLCQVTGSAIVGINGALPNTPQLTGTYEYCENDVLGVINATGTISGGTFGWYINDTTGSPYVITGAPNVTLPTLPAGTNTLYVIHTVGGCASYSGSAPISYTEIDYTIQREYQYCAGETVQVSGFAGLGDFYWNDANNELSSTTIPNPVVTPLNNINTYIFEYVTGACIYVDSISVIENLDCGGTLDEITNAFSPDGDGINDTWVIDGIDQHENNRVTVFNRWGDQVLQLENYHNTTNNWSPESSSLNGGASGIDFPSGTYFYIVELFDINESYNGWVQLTK